MAKGNNTVPERLINFRVYNNGADLLGIANVDLPELAAMTDTVSGAGIAGEVESPILGHFGSMTSTFTWRTIEEKAIDLAAQKSHMIEVRGSQQVYDASTGTYQTKAVRATMQVVPKNISLGSFAVGSTTDTETEFEVLYIKLYIAGKAILEIDKFNYKCVINGTDLLAGVKVDLGVN